MRPNFSPVYTIFRLFSRMSKIKKAIATIYLQSGSHFDAEGLRWNTKKCMVKTEVSVNAYNLRYGTVKDAIALKKRNALGKKTRAHLFIEKTLAKKLELHFSLQTSISSHSPIKGNL